MGAISFIQHPQNLTLLPFKRRTISRSSYVLQKPSTSVIAQQKVTSQCSSQPLPTSYPRLLAPWLMYWVVLACALFFESWTGFILVWVPFYAWIRLGFLLYLILPQTQGAKVLYLSHVHPWLQTNERSIDDFISSAHDRAKAAGYTYLKQAVELIKQNLLGLPPKEPTPPSTPSTFSYTQSLIARFNLPSARPAFPAMPATSTATDFYSLLAS